MERFPFGIYAFHSSLTRGEDSMRAECTVPSSELVEPTNEVSGFATSARIRKYAEMPLELVNTQLRNALESITDCYFALDHSCNIIDVNNALLTWAGMQRRELVGTNLWKLCKPTDPCGSITRDAIQHRHKQHAELRSALRPDRWLDYHAYPSPGGAVVIFHDITDRKLAEQEVAKSNGLLCATLDALSAHIAILDGNGTILAVNKAWHQFAADKGYIGTDHGIGRNYLDICRAAADTDLAAAPIGDKLEKILAGQENKFVCEYMCGRNWFQIRLSRFERDGDVHVVVAHENITELIAAKQRLLHSEDRVALATAFTNSGIWQMYAQDQPIIGLESCATLFGLQNGQNYKLSDLLKVIHAEDRYHFARSMHAALRDASLIDFRFRVILQDGSIRWVCAKASASVQADKGVIVNGLFMDVTQVKQLETDRDLQRRELFQLSRQATVNELAGSIAHELNQPLASIMANAEAGLGHIDLVPPDIEAIRKILNDIVEDDSRAANIIGRVRRLMRKDANSFEPVKFDRLFESTYALVRSELVRKGISLEIDCSSDLPSIFGEFVQLQQILVNLLMNAMESICASPLPDSNHKILLSAKLVEKRVRIVVSDNGPGISKEVQSRLFKPFVSTKSSGLGLGLSICSTIAEVHGGDIVLQNNSDGGASATLTLPIGQVRGPEP
jgi:PAS domain S-box-containing protein